MSAEGGPERLARFYEDSAFPGQSFNSSLMVFLPKTPTGQNAAVGDYHAPGDTRPLNIGNSENRILANAVRSRVEALLPEWISEMQQGFVVGRSLLSNVVSVDQEMMRCALLEDSAVAVFFDFRAAFPSVGHSFLADTLEHLGLPQWFLRFFTALYHGNRCDLVVGGARHAGFSLQAGIRQGCPLSPLVFSLAADLLLRRLRRLSPDSLVRAYADDLTVVLPAGLRKLPELQVIFAEYAMVSGLHLNLPKTVLIPLFHTDTAALTEQMAQACPGWAGVRVAFHAKYLGFYLGPGRGHHAYADPLRIYSERASGWGSAGVGLLYTLTAYAVFVLPVLSFVSQLDGPPPDWEETEAAAIRKLFPGPGQWCCPDDLRCLQLLGFPKSLPDLRVRSVAAQCRVAHLEASGQGGLRATERAAELRRWRDESDYVVRKAQWAHWFDRAFVVQLHSATERCRAKGATRRSIELSLTGGAPRPHPQAIDAAIRRGFQRAACRVIEPDRSGYMRARMHHRAQLRRLPGNPETMGDRATEVLQALATAAPPKVWAAMLRTLWNGWCTKRRMEQIGGTGCIFGCAGVDDSIEHYARCPAVADFARRRLGLTPALDPQDHDAGIGPAGPAA